MRAVGLKEILKASISFVVVITLSTVCMSVSANTKKGAAYQPLPFPDELKSYETPIFNLFDKSSDDKRTHERHYDAEFVKRFREALKPYFKLDPNLEKKLFSGPAPDGNYIEIDGTRYIFYTICQAHACNTTNIAVLYQPDTKRITGRLQYKCDLLQMNGPQPNESAAIESLSPIDKRDAFYQESCKYEKRGAK